MKTRYSVLATSLLCLFMAFFTGGCGHKEGPDFSVQVKDPQGITNGSKVEWRGTMVGQVTHLEQADNQVRVDVKLSPDFKNTFTDGLTARPTRHLLSGSTTLELFGGNDPRMPKLKAGAIIEEAAPESIWTSWKAMAGISLLIGLALLVVLIKVIGRILAFSVALAFLVFSLWFCKQQYIKHQDAFRGTRVEMLMATLQEKLVDTPEAAAFWASMRSETTNIIGTARQKSGDALSEKCKTMQNKVEKKAAEMLKSGQTAAAEKLQETFETFKKESKSGQFE